MVPADGVVVTLVNPAGTASLTRMLVAASGPRLVAVMVNVTESPTFADVGDTIFRI